MDSPKFKIAIIGGGIGGLTTAVALSKSPDFEVEIYESANDFGELGAGLGIWPRGWKVLDKLGIGNDLANITSDPLDDEIRLTYRFRHSEQAEGKDIGELISEGGLPTFHRSELHQTILKRVPAYYKCHLSKRLVSYIDTGTGPVSLIFQDGSTATCDLLIGADGVKSAVRGTLLKAYSQQSTNITAEEISASHVKWSGSVAYRALAPLHLIKSRMPEHRALSGLAMYCGKYKHLLAYPISRDNYMNVVAFASNPSLEDTTYQGPWMVDLTNEYLLEVFSGWEEEVKVLLECVEDPKQFAVHALKPLPSYTFGRAVLLGDAAHAMTPHQGSGAGQAIEDAYVLATLLSDPACTTETLLPALKAYSDIRKPAAERVVEGSRQNGTLFDFYDDRLEGDNVRPLFTERLEEIKAESWARAWKTTIDTDVEAALAMFRLELLKTGDIQTPQEELVEFSRL